MISRRWKRAGTPGQSDANLLDRADRWIKDRLLFLGRTFLWHEMDTRSFSLPNEPDDRGPFGQIGPRSMSTIRTGAAATGRAAASPFGAFITVTIGDSAIRVLVARGNRVRSWAEAHLPVGVVQDGLIVDESTFSEALEAVIEEIGKGAKLNGAKVAVAITGRNVVQRRFTVFLEPGENLTEAIIDASAERMSIRPEELQLAWDAAKASYDTTDNDDDGEDEQDAFEVMEADLESDLDGDPFDVYAFGMYRHVLRRNLRTLANSGAKFSTVQPKAIALAAAANERSGVILDIEANSITVVVLRDGLPEVVREVGIDQKMTSAQWIQSVTTQVSRTVAFHDSMYPDTPLPEDSVLFLTGSSESIVGSAEMAASSIPYRRKSLPPTLRAPDDFPFARYAANVGLALVTGKHWWQRTRVSIIDRPMLDFRPTEFKPRPFPVQATLTASMVGVLLLTLGGIFQMTAAQESSVASAKEELFSLQRNVGLKELRVRRAADQRAEITQLQIQTEDLLDKINLVKDRERGFARVVDVITDHASSIAGVDVLELDDDGKIVGLSLGGLDFTGLLRFVRLLESEPGFTDVRIRSVGSLSAAEVSEGTGSGSGAGVGQSGGGGQLPGGPLAAPEDIALQHPVTFSLTLSRTLKLDPPPTEEQQIELLPGS